MKRRVFFVRSQRPRIFGRTKLFLQLTCHWIFQTFPNGSNGLGVKCYELFWAIITMFRSLCFSWSEFGKFYHILFCQVCWNWVNWSPPARHDHQILRFNLIFSNSFSFNQAVLTSFDNPVRYPPERPPDVGTQHTYQLRGSCATPRPHTHTFVTDLDLVVFSWQHLSPQIQC